jgi:hypothetical protein
MRYIPKWMEVTMEVLIVVMTVVIIKLVYDLYKIIKEKQQ